MAGSSAVRAGATGALTSAAAPTTLAVAHVLAIYGESAGHWTSIVRALVVCLVVAGAIGIATWFVFRRVPYAVTVGCLLTLAICGNPAGLPVFLGFGAWLVYAVWGRIRKAPHAPFPSAAIMIFLTALLIGAATAPAINGTVSPADFAPESAIPRPRDTSGALSDQGNLYVVLLDGYPRVDTLHGSYGYDNSEFQHALGALGFQVHPRATSPTARTERTLLAMLDNPDVDRGAPPIGWETDIDDRRRTRRLLAEAPVLDELRAAGYELVHVPSPIVHTQLGGWDVLLDSGHLNELEILLIQQSPLAHLLGQWVFAQQRERIEYAFEALVASSSSEQQQAVFVHVLAPHPPFVLSSIEPPSCWATRRCGMYGIRPDHIHYSDGEFRALFLRQLTALNAQVVITATQVVESDPGATIIIMSDHGARADDDASEWTRSFLAGRNAAFLEQQPDVENLFWRWLQWRSDETAPGG